MKTFLLSISTYYCGLYLAAQPVITSANLPLTGDHITIAICSHTPNPANLDAETGMNYTWNFSHLPEQEEQFFDYVEPTSTAWDDLFTESNRCRVGWEGSHSYYYFGSDGIYAEGNITLTGTDTFKVFFTNLEKFTPLPFSTGSTSSDTFEGWAAGAGFNTTLSGTVDFQADGHGTLVFPNGTYSNVVRYRLNRTQNSSFNGIPGNTVTKKQWGWFSAGHRFWLLLMEIINDGFSDQPLVWYNKSPHDVVTGISRPEAGITRPAYPNPALSGSTVYIPDAGISRVELLDMTGRLIYMAGNTPAGIALNGIMPGIYLLRTVDMNGETQRSERLVVR